MLPTVVLVGRPNVGKSTLFNRLTRSRDALVADLPGLTRDRHYGKGRVGDKPYLVVDTGGLEPVAKDGIMFEMAKQSRQAIDEADIVMFLVDGRSGCTPQDAIIAEQLRKTGKPIMLLVNKAEGMARAKVTADFFELGLGEPLPISSAHGDNVTEVVEIALESFPLEVEEQADHEVRRRRDVAAVNVRRRGVSVLVLLSADPHRSAIREAVADHFAQLFDGLFQADHPLVEAANGLGQLFVHPAMQFCNHL